MAAFSECTFGTPSHQEFSRNCEAEALARIPEEWNHPAEKDSRQINRLGHVLVAKPLHTVAGHALAEFCGQYLVHILPMNGLIGFKQIHPSRLKRAIDDLT